MSKSRWMLSGGFFFAFCRREHATDYVLHRRVCGIVGGDRHRQEDADRHVEISEWRLALVVGFVADLAPIVEFGTCGAILALASAGHFLSFAIGASRAEQRGE